MDIRNDHRAPELQLASQLHRLSQLLSQPFNEEHEATLGLSHAQWRVLVTIIQSPGTTARAVAEVTGFTAMHVSRAVQTLKQTQRITVTPDPADLRRQLLTPTDTGLNDFKRLAPLALADVHSVLSVLEPHEFEQFVEYVRRVTRAAENLR